MTSMRKNEINDLMQQLLCHKKFALKMFRKKLQTKTLQMFAKNVTIQCFFNVSKNPKKVKRTPLALLNW